MLPLDAPRWSNLNHAFGGARGVPVALQTLGDCLASTTPINPDPYKQAFRAMIGQIDMIFHQACVSTVAGAAIPYLCIWHRVCRWMIKSAFIASEGGWTAKVRNPMKQIWRPGTDDPNRTRIPSATVSFWLLWSRFAKSDKVACVRTAWSPILV